jgi:hypothetical protein
MIKAFRLIPEPLQRQILYRLGCGAVVLVLTIALLYYTMEIYSVLFCAAVIVFCVVSSFLLFRRAVTGDYVVIRGECLNTVRTLLKRRTKKITVRTDDNHIIDIMIKNRLKKIRVGSSNHLHCHRNNGA